MKRFISIFSAIIIILCIAPLSSSDTDMADFFNIAEASAANMKTVVSSKSAGDKIKFGSYPQTDVTASMGSVLTAKAPATSKWTSYNYYINGKKSDYMKFCDLSYKGKRYRGIYFTSYRPYSLDSSDSHQSTNGYSKKTIYWFRYDPLKWIVLNPSTGYVICENVIDSQAFNNTYYPRGKDAYNFTAYYNDKTYSHLANSWEYSSIRTWLNETFFTTAFSESERNQIPCTKLTTPAYSSSYSAFNVGKTGDYVFLPSYKDMVNTSYGFSKNCNKYDANRLVHSSDYAKSQGVYVSTLDTDTAGKYTSSYSCRTAGMSSDCIAEVSRTGSISCIWSTDYTGSGIRPALCFNPSSTGTYSCKTHNYTTTITKATLSKNGKITKQCCVCRNTKTTTVYHPKTFTLSKKTYSYTGKAIKPSVKVTDINGKTINSSNYAVTYKNNTKAGTATVIITFKGNYSDTKKLSFIIKK